MLSHGPSISLSFAIEEPTACGSIHAQPPLTEAQRLKAIESYALIAASHPVSVKKLVDESETARPSQKRPIPLHLRKSATSETSVPPPGRKNLSLRVSLRVQDTFRNYMRLRVPNQIHHPPNSERHRPSQELRQMFANHEQDSEEVNTIFNRMRNLVEPRQIYCQS